MRIRVKLALPLKAAVTEIAVKVELHIGVCAEITAKRDMSSPQQQGC